MNKSIAITAFSLYCLWSIVSLLQGIDMYSGERYVVSLSYLIVLLLLLIESLAIIVIFLNINNVLTSRLNLVILIWIFYILFNALVNSHDIFLDLREILWWPLTYFLFYFISYCDHNNRYVYVLFKYFPYFFFLIACLYSIIRFFSLDSQSFITQVVLSVNHVFYLVLLIPFVFLIQKKPLKYLFLIIGLFSTLLSFKRSAMVFVGLILLMSVYFDFLRSRKNGVAKGFFIASILFFSFFLIFDYIDDSTGGYISYRIELSKDDSGSGRLDTFYVVWEKFNEKRLIYRLLGSGHNAVRNEAIMTLETVVSAHNDFLEVLYDYGILGFLLYLTFIGLILKRTYSLRNINYLYFQSHLAILIIFFVMTMVSHLVLYPTYFAYLIIVLAIAEGQRKRNPIIYV